MTVVLTGSTGFLGVRVAGVLRDRRLDWRPLTARLDEVGARDLAGAASVIHCAAATPGRGCSDEEYLAVNAEGTGRLVRACEEAGVRRFVLVSSMGVKLASGYARSKLLAEERVKASRLDWLVLRPAHIYGPTPQLRGTMTKLKRKWTWSVLGAGRCPVQLVYVDDCAAAVVDAALSPRSHETLNVIAPECSEIDYVRALRRATGSATLILRMPFFWARMRRGAAEVEARMAGLRIPGVADWPLAATPLEAGLRRTYEALQSQGR
jgi:nucleoside-diphosphate-sugar epimerase